MPCTWEGEGITSDYSFDYCRIENRHDAIWHHWRKPLVNEKCLSALAHGMSGMGNIPYRTFELFFAVGSRLNLMLIRRFKI